MISRVEEAEKDAEKELREARIRDRADHIEAGGNHYGTAGERAKEMAIGVLCPIAGLVRSGENQRLAEDARDVANMRVALAEAGITGGDHVESHSAPSAGGRARPKSTHEHE